MAKPPAPKDAPRSPFQRLADWAHERLRHEGKLLVPRVAVVGEGREDYRDFSKLYPRLGQSGLVDAAAVLARTAAPDDLVAVLFPMTVGGVGIRTKDRTGVTDGFGALVIARSRAGAAFARLFWAQLVQRRKYVILGEKRDPGEFPQYDDWTTRGAVDPAVENVLAGAQWPGAVATAAATSSQATQPATAGPESGTSTPRRHCFVPLGDACPWETARNCAPDIEDVGPKLGSDPFCLSVIPEPPEMWTRPLAELIASTAGDELLAAHAGWRLTREPDLRAALRALLDAEVPALAKVFGCAHVAHVAGGRGDDDAEGEAAGELVRRMAAVIDEAGGLEPWIATRWPREPTRLEMSGIGTSSAMNAAFWSLERALRAKDLPAVDAAVASAERLRDALLDRAGIRAPTAGARMCRAATLVVGAGAGRGEPRFDRWSKAVLDVPKNVNPAIVLRNMSLLHAMVIHSMIAVARLTREGLGALDTGDLGAWAPDRAPVEGLLREALEVLARHCVLRAAREAGTPRALELLSHARSIAGWDPVIVACHDEARFRAGVRDGKLLADLERATTATPTLGACAEYLRVAVHLGGRRDVTLACKRLRAAAEGSAHAWMAEVRIAFARPHELASPERIDALLAAPPPAEKLDARERAVFALYGEDPAAAAAQVRRDLEFQRDALALAALQEQERIEEILTRPPRERRPDVPRREGPGAAEAAIEALRVRLDRPWTGKHPLKPDLERHASAAGLLAAHDDAPVAAWLSALGDGETGLVPLLDRAIRGDSDAGELLGLALERAAVALDTAVQAVWFRDFQERLNSVWPVIGSLGDVADLRRQAQEVRAATEGALDAARRDSLERELTALLEAVQTRRAASSAPQRGARPETRDPDEDDFRMMSVEARAVARSRDDLATPEWAINKGLAEVLRYNTSRGRRDIKMLRGSRDADGALWELRVRDPRLPVRVMYQLGGAGPVAVAIIAKQDDAHQRRLIERVQGW